MAALLAVLCLLQGTCVELRAETVEVSGHLPAIGTRVEQIVKSLIFKAQHSGKPILVVASGINRVNEKRLSDLVGEPIGKADADFVRQSTGFAVGGVPPIGHTHPLETSIDEDLLC